MNWMARIVLTVVGVALFASCADGAEEQGWRHVFIDTSLIESAKGFEHVMNPAERAGQVIFPDRPWDSHGVWAWVSVAEWEGSYHMWYDGVGENGRYCLCYAQSKDGLTWTKPELGLIDYEGSTANNIVYLGRPGGIYHGGSVFLDHHGKPEARFKFVYGGGPYISNYGHQGVDAAISADGIRFTPVSKCPITPWYTDCGNVVFWDDQREKYALYVRHWTKGFEVTDGKVHVAPPLGKRAVGRTESADFFNFPEPVSVLEPDDRDPDDMQMYNSAAHKYPWAPDTYLIFLGAFYLEPDTVDVQIATSRDGIAWKREHRAPFLPMGAGDAFDSLEVYMGTGMLARGDELLMYYGGFDVVHGKTNFAQGMGGVGCCKIRKDGFFSMDAGYEGGEMVTAPVSVTGTRLDVNCDTSAGGLLRVELLDASGAALPGFTLAEAKAIRGKNAVSYTVAWKNGANLTSLCDQNVKIRFVGRDCKVYAFGFGG